MTYHDRLMALRQYLETQNVDAYIQPRGDEFQGEHVPKFAERLAWLTGFDGSAGYAVITKDEACVLIDGRYTIQVKDQVDLNDYETAHYTDVHPGQWASDHLKPGMKCAIDPKLFTMHFKKTVEAIFQKNGVELVLLNENPIDVIWEDQPEASNKPYSIYPNELAGQSSKDKRQSLAQELKTKNVSAAFIASPESVAWLLNIRGGDVDMTPLPLTHAILHDTGKVDFICDPSKVTDEVSKHLGDDITLVAMNDAETYLGKLSDKILVDPKSTSAWVGKHLKAEIIEGQDPCAWPRGCKNDIEIQNMKEAHIVDGVAVTKFLHWLDTKALSEDTDEISAQEKLLSFRQESDDFLEPSFDTISGFGANGAIVHYHATPKTNLKFEEGGLYLVDSGGQYLKGTTDITRTIAIGEPSQEMRENYTRVLQGHIGLAMAKFPKGLNGTSLDAFARKALWDARLDFAHGTGHGVGVYLHVHEGPAGISPRSTEPIKEGLILSNEPGYYKEGEYGIRIESLIAIKDAGQGPDGLNFLECETITMAPLDKKLIVTEMLNELEIAWINNYHAQVFNVLSDKLPEDVQKWFAQACAPLLGVFAA